jgi:hypothetical protein
MSSHPQAAPDRTRKRAEDVGVFALATVGAVYTTLTMGPAGLGVGCILLSAAASIVVAREDGVHDPAPESTPDPKLATDGGREEH